METKTGKRAENMGAAGASIYIATKIFLALLEAISIKISNKAKAG